MSCAYEQRGERRGRHAIGRRAWRDHITQARGKGHARAIHHRVAELIGHRRRQKAGIANT